MLVSMKINFSSLIIKTFSLSNIAINPWSHRCFMDTNDWASAENICAFLASAVSWVCADSIIVMSGSFTWMPSCVLYLFERSVFTHTKWPVVPESTVGWFWLCWIIFTANAYFCFCDDFFLQSTKTMSFIASQINIFCNPIAYYETIICINLCSLSFYQYLVLLGTTLIDRNRCVILMTNRFWSAWWTCVALMNVIYVRPIVVCMYI